MRIEAYNQVAQLYQTSNTKNVSQAAKSNQMGRDEVQISSTGRDFNVAKAVEFIFKKIKKIELRMAHMM